MSISGQAITFLEDRLKEDKEFATAVAEVPAAGQQRRAPVDQNYLARWDPARVLAEVEAQREILVAYQKFTEVADEVGRVPGGDVSLVAAFGAGLEMAVRLHLAAHVDRPGFDEKWLR